jgi:hypothetical protein
MTSLADDTPAAGECGMRAESALGHPDTPEAPCGPEILRAAAKRPLVDWIGCGGCDNRWTGLRACHCGACHLTFTGIRGFDIHRRGSRCNDPATVGLVQIPRQHWTGWGEPGQDERFSRDGGDAP